MKRIGWMLAVASLTAIGACGNDDPLLDGRIVPTPAPTEEDTGPGESSTQSDVADIRANMEANPNVPEPIEDFDCPDTFVKVEAAVMECVATLESGMIIDVEVTYVNNLGQYEFSFQRRD